MAFQIGNNPISFDDWLKKQNFDVDGKKNGVDNNGSDVVKTNNEFVSKYGSSATVFDVTEADYRVSTSLTTQNSGSGAASSGSNPMSMDNSVFSVQQSTTVDGTPQPPGVDGVRTVTTSALTAPSKNEGSGPQGGSTSGNNQPDMNSLYSQYQEEISDLKSQGDGSFPSIPDDFKLDINPDGSLKESAKIGENSTNVKDDTQPDVKDNSEKDKDEQINQNGQPVNRQEKTRDIDKQQEKTTEEKNKKRIQESKDDRAA